MATKTEPPTKVRLACRRCRIRRTKCDGHVPACSNCARVGETCLDVDSQNSQVLIPRNFVSEAKERILWLEDIIRDCLPGVDLDSGPRVEAYPGEENDDSTQEAPDVTISAAGQAQETTRGGESLQGSPRSTLERPLVTDTPVDHAGAFSDQAHSVAVNLGMLSLHPDSLQRHYIGSSSGLLFTQLIGSSPSSSVLPSPDLEGPPSSRLDWSPSAAILDSQRQYYCTLHHFLRQELPKKEDADILVRTYLHWVHPDFPVLDPESLCAALEFIYASSSCSVDDDALPAGWPSSLGGFNWNGRELNTQSESPDMVPMPVIAFIIFVVLSIGAVLQVRSRVYEFPPEKFHRAALYFAKDCFARISLDAIQALVTLIIHGIFTPTAANIWTLTHVGIAHCIEIGIHREQVCTTTEETRHQEIKRYVFWTLYSLDRTISSIQGRPLGFRDETFDTRKPQPESISPDHLATSVPASLTQAFAQYTARQFSVDRIISDIKLHLYLLPQNHSKSPWAMDPVEQQGKIQHKLMDWWRAASVLDFDYALDRRASRIWHLRLKIRFHMAMILLFQPSEAIRSLSKRSLKICYENASKVLNDYQALHDIQGVYHDWRTVQNVFAAGATMISSFWMSKDIRHEASAAELSRSLRTCSSLLSIGGEWWPSAKRCHSSFGSVADLTMQKLYMEARPLKQARVARPPNTRPIDLGPERNVSTDGHGSTLERSPGNNNGSPDPAHFDRNQRSMSGVRLPPEHKSSDHLGYDVIPEIEDFLAGFDKADLGWNLDVFEDAVDLANLLP